MLVTWRSSEELVLLGHSKCLIVKVLPVLGGPTNGILCWRILEIARDRENQYENQYTSFVHFGPGLILESETI